MKRRLFRYNPDTTAGRIIVRFGGLVAFAKAMGLSISTVQRWWESGFIPARRQAQVLRVAQDHGIPLTAEDVIAPEPVRGGKMEEHCITRCYAIPMPEAQQSASS